MNKQTEKILAEFNAGVDIKDLARRYFLTAKQMKDYLTFYGVVFTKNKKPRAIMPERAELLNTYFVAGNVNKAARVYGVCSATITRWLKNQNIPVKKMKFQTQRDEVKYIDKHLSMIA